MRFIARRLALDFLSFASRITGKFDQLKNQTAVQLIVLHHVEPSEENRFQLFLEWLGKCYQVSSYSDAVERIQSGAVSRPIAAISFDDGLKNNLVAAKLLSDHGMSACFFVCPDIVGETDSEKIAAFCRQRMLFDHDAEFMDWHDLNRLKSLGHEIGNHSQSHYYMMDLSDDEFAEQVSRARDKIAAELGPPKHFAWPYGRFQHFKKTWVKNIFETGHVSCASGERGAHASHADDVAGERFCCLRRDSLDMSWPIQHCKYFLARSTLNPLMPESTWP